MIPVEEIMQAIQPLNNLSMPPHSEYCRQHAPEYQKQNISAALVVDEHYLTCSKQPQK